MKRTKTTERRSVTIALGVTLGLAGSASAQVVPAAPRAEAHLCDGGLICENPLAVFPDGTLLGPVAGDFDGDGLGDLAFYLYDGQTGLNIRTKLARGDLSWRSEEDELFDGETSAPIVADVDGDGDDDLLFIWVHGVLGMILRTKLSNSDGSWTSAEQVLGDGALLGPLVGDFNGDEREDVLHFQYGPGGLELRSRFSNGDGTWAVAAQTLGDGQLLGPVVGDVNGDGRSDLVFWQFGPQGLELRTKFAVGNGTWTAAAQTLGDGTLPEPVSGDFNGDGRADLAFPFVHGVNGLTVRSKLSNGDGTWTPLEQVLGDGPGLAGPLVAELNADGRDDLVFWHVGGGGLELRGRPSLGDGTFGSMVAEPGFGAGIDQNEPFAMDVTHDGKAELVFWWFNESMANPLMLYTARFDAVDHARERRRAEVVSGWSDVWRAFLHDRLCVEDRTNVKYSQRLNDAQFYTNLFFDYALSRGEYGALNELAGELLIAKNYLQVRPYWFQARSFQHFEWEFQELLSFWGNDETLNLDDGQDPCANTVPILREQLLGSSQFCYFVAHAINAFLALPQAVRDAHPNMDLLIDEYASVLVDDHYLRWALSWPNLQSGIDAWTREDCPSGDVYWRPVTPVPPPVQGYFSVDETLPGLEPAYSHRDFLQEKLDGDLAYVDAQSCQSYQALSDIDLWVFAGAIELLAAHERAPSRIPFPEPCARCHLIDYVAVALDAFRARLIPNPGLTDFYGNPAEGLIFDEGCWSDHHFYEFANAPNLDWPPQGCEPSGLCRSATVTFDISHLSRLVFVVDTLIDNRSLLDGIGCTSCGGTFTARSPSFPTDATVRKIVNQLAFEVFNRDLKQPLFTNYMDASPGWNEVRFVDGFGYAPGDFSIAYLYGGYPRWARHLPELRWVSDAVLEMLERDAGPLADHRTTRFEHCRYDGGVRVDCFDLGPDNPDRKAEYPFFLFLATYETGP